LFVSIALLMLAAPFSVAQKHKPKTRSASEPAEKSSALPKRDRDPAVIQIEVGIAFRANRHFFLQRYCYKVAGAM